MKRLVFRVGQLPLAAALGSQSMCQARRFQAAAAHAAPDASAENAAGDEKSEQQQQQQQSQGEKQQGNSSSTALGATEEPKRRNIVVLSNTTKAVYIHPTNHIASWYWFITDFHKWFAGLIVIFIGSQVLARYRIAKANTAMQAQIGENLLDQRTRDLLNDIEVLRNKDPIRLEHEANEYHEQFWKRRAVTAAQNKSEARQLEIKRGKLQGEARGTDMTEWLGAKEKDDEEREVARRTQDYIQGFHQHLKSKRLI